MASINRDSQANNAYFDYCCAGTLCAACELVRQTGAHVAALAVVIELTNLPGRSPIEALPADMFVPGGQRPPLVALLSIDEGHV